MTLYSGENSAVRPFDLDLVALPAGGSEPKPLADFQCYQIRSMLEGHRSGLLRPRSEVRKRGGAAVVRDCTPIHSCFATGRSMLSSSGGGLLADSCAWAGGARKELEYFCVAKKSRAAFDVQNALYQWGPPQGMSEYFNLPEVAVAPMGFAWAMYLVQNRA